MDEAVAERAVDLFEVEPAPFAADVAAFRARSGDLVVPQPRIALARSHHPSHDRGYDGVDGPVDSRVVAEIAAGFRVVEPAGGA
ncbi:hypothetical protein [Nocardia nova]|uniref:hypothetical protein n=1 Tax=Nocardia nova TaxID=37330 RepID=UPI001CA518E2|nr:hypothetical protein [Nocardia nova]